MDQFCVFQIFTAGLRPTTGWCGVAQIPCLGRQMVGSKCMSSPPAENEVCAAAISSNPAKHSISDGLRCWTNDEFQTSDWVVLSVYSWIFGLFDNFLGDGWYMTRNILEYLDDIAEQYGRLWVNESGRPGPTPILCALIAVVRDSGWCCVRTGSSSQRYRYIDGRRRIWIYWWDLI